MNLGSIALSLALASGTTALAAYVAWALLQIDVRGIARSFTGLMALSVAVASAFQMRNILTHQFQYEYVTNFSDRSLPTLLLASTFWGGSRAV